MKKLLTVILVIIFIFACSSGGNGEGDNSGSLSRPALNAGIDLRLGQLSNSSSSVAISASLQNGESITIFAENNAEDFEAILVSPTSDTLQVKLDPAGRPSLVQFLGTTISYSNYTKENTVDITIQTSDTSRKAKTITLLNQPINLEVLNYLNSDAFLSILLQLDKDADSEARALLAAVVGALRFVGCGVEQATSALEGIFPQAFLGDEVCKSDLINAVEDILEFSNYQAILVNLVNRYQECDSPQGYEQESACALVIWKDLVEAAKDGIVGNYPRGNDDGEDTGGSSSTTGSSTGTETSTGKETSTGDSTDTSGTPPTNTPTPTSTPTPTFTPTFTPTSTPSGGFFGSWCGKGTGNGTPSSDCSGFSINFSVVSGPDTTCNSPNCSLSGVFSNEKSGDIYNINSDVLPDGTYHFNSNNTSDTSLILTVTSGKLIPEDEIIHFQITRGTSLICDGTYMAKRDSQCL